MQGGIPGAKEGVEDPIPVGMPTQKKENKATVGPDTLTMNNAGGGSSLERKRLRKSKHRLKEHHGSGTRAEMGGE